MHAKLRTESCKIRKGEGGKAKTKILLSTKVSEAASDGVKRVAPEIKSRRGAVSAVQRAGADETTETSGAHRSVASDTGNRIVIHQHQTPKEGQ